MGSICWRGREAGAVRDRADDALRSDRPRVDLIGDGSHAGAGRTTVESWPRRRSEHRTTQPRRTTCPRRPAGIDAINLIMIPSTDQDRSIEF
jgi:hypothetical protein